MSTSDSTWTGPSAKQMIETNTLAKEIMERHKNGPEAVFDPENLEMLRDFLESPELAQANIFAKYAVQTSDDALAKISDGKGASLVDYIAAAHGTPKQALTSAEIEDLQTWFANGMA